MKYLTKKKVEQLVTELLRQNISPETKRELERYFGESYSKAQLERIWYRYQYRKSEMQAKETEAAGTNPFYRNTKDRGEESLAENGIIRRKSVLSEEIKQRIAAVRALMAERGIDAYLVVSDDYHASEYVGDYFKCREYLSGFDGSAGTMVITAGEAGLWTDGRYFIQADAQLAGTGIRLWRMGEPDVPEIKDYLAENMQEGQCLAYDGKTLSIRYAEELKQRLEALRLSYQEDVDLVGCLWEERPAFPEEPVWILEEKYTGKSRTEKLAKLREVMQKEGASVHLLASLDDIAWLFNLRGNDIAYNPVALSYGLIREEGAVLYIAEGAVDNETAGILMRDGIELRPYLQVYEDLQKLKAGERIMLDRETTNIALLSRIPEETDIIYRRNPTCFAKAVKNHTEMENIRQAHIQDGVALTKLIYWLKQEAQAQAICQGKLTELDLACRLKKLRKERPGYIEASFAPIIASGAHGAIVHYEPTDDTDMPIETDQFLLMDTGGHYLQGTTDVTRTVAIGRISEKQQEHYTAVLQGNLRLGNAYFKYGYSGCHLDYLAREALWRLGLDYNHGTGHGVGYLLNVHEGPQGIRKQERAGQIGTVLEEGMLTSNEPGIYIEGEYGIRLENLLLCRKAKKTAMGQFMCFETVTLVPFEREAILPERMTEQELELLNAYHAGVYEKLSPYLTEEERQWLAETTAPMMKNSG